MTGGDDIERGMMPNGTRHVEIGRLNASGADFILRVDAGGTWRLDAGLVMGWRAKRLVGRRVRVTGDRIGFDLLSIVRIEPEPSAVRREGDVWD